MKTWLKRNRIKIFMALFGLFCISGLYLSLKSKETKDIVASGIAHQKQQLRQLNIENRQIKREAIVARIAVVLVASSADSIIRHKQHVIDSLTHAKPSHETLPDSVRDPDADAVLQYFANYRPRKIALAPGDTLY